MVKKLIKKQTGGATKTTTQKKIGSWTQTPTESMNNYLNKQDSVKVKPVVKAPTTTFLKKKGGAVSSKKRK